MAISRLAAVISLGVFVGCSAPTRPEQVPRLLSGATLPGSPVPPPPAPTPPAPTVPAPPAPDLAGNYTVTLSAAECSSTFPADFASRRYPSQLHLTGTSAVLEIFQIDGGASFNPSMRGTFAAPDRMTLTSYLGNDQYENLFEQVSPTNLVAILADEMRLTVSPTGWVGTFEGAFLLYSGRQGHWPSVVALCRSTRHTVSLTR